jgi:hypothetical protein
VATKTPENMHLTLLLNINSNISGLFVLGDTQKVTQKNKAKVVTFVTF